MKGGKDEEKITSPLFPRLHVNDTEKGGPRAPPRNKMALYEQLSIPSQRFNSVSGSTFPLPPSSLVPSVSLSQGGGHERPPFSPFYIPSPTPAHSAEKLLSSSSDGVNLNTVMADFERKSMKNESQRTLNASGRLSSTAECGSFHPHDFSNSKNSSRKELGDEDDFTVPTFVYSRTDLCLNKDQQDRDREGLNPYSTSHPGCSTVTPGNSTLKTAAATFSSLMPLQNACDKHLKRTNTANMKSRQHLRNQSEENLKESATRKECAERIASNPSNRETISEPLKHAKASSNQEYGSSHGDGFGRSHDINVRLHQEYSAGFLPENTTHSDGVSAEPMGCVEKSSVSTFRSESCPRASLGNGHRSPREAENGSKYHEDKPYRSLQLRDMDRNDDVSEASMVDSISGLDISPDDVVGVIGRKHFFKARREIVNQQRVFAVQVFELHRLIKVQTLIAGSPQLLLEDNSYLSKPSLKVSPAKKLPSGYALKSPPQIVKHKDDSQKPNQRAECAAENAIGKPPLPSVSDGINKGVVNQHSSYGPYSGNSPPAPVAANNMAGPWSFHPPPGNQWLVPVMSPSEGLVYKPYTGPYPPAAGFMAPIYGGCGPLSLPPVAGDFRSPAYGFPASHPQGFGVLSSAPPVAQSYFPPYGMPAMNPVTSASDVEQVSPLAGARPHGQAEQLLRGDVNFNMHSRNSCNKSNQKNEAISCAWKFQRSKVSELQGSTASSPSERAQGAGAGNVSEGSDALPLFPMAPALHLDRPTQSHSSDQQPRVIKVVPHNRRSATESAARIFQSIQEERQQYDSV